MKKSMYFLLCFVLLSLDIVANQAKEDAQESENISNNSDKNQNTFAHNRERERQFESSNILSKPKFLNSLLYSIYVSTLKKATYVDPETFEVISLHSYFEEKDEIVVCKVNHTRTSNILRVFNKEEMKKLYTKKLENGEEVIVLPQGAPIQTIEIDPVKAVFWSVIGLAVVAAIYNGRSGVNNSGD